MYFMLSQEALKCSAKSTTGDGGESVSHTYILEPVTAGAKMTRNLSALPLRSPKEPRIHMDIQVNTVFGWEYSKFGGCNKL